MATVALIVSLLSVLFHVLREIRDRRQDKAARDKQKRALADGVSAWVEVEDTPVGAVVTTCVQNDAALPVRHASVRVVNASDTTVAFHYHAVIPPGKALTDTEMLSGRRAEFDDLRASVTFTDSNQLRWHRGLSGLLQELPPKFTVLAGRDVRSGLERYRRLFEEEFCLNVEVKTGRRGTDLRKFFESPDYYADQGDAIVGPHDWLGSFRARGILRTVPVPKVEPQDPLIREAFETYLVGTESDGVPLAYDTTVLFINRDMFTGEVPRSVHELFALGRTSAAGTAGAPRSGRSIGVSLSMGERAGEGDPFMIWPVISGLGGTLFEPAGDSEWKPSVKALQAPALVSALVAFQELAQRYPESFQQQVSHAEARQLFAAGKVPFHIDVAGARAELDPNMNYSLARAPLGTHLKRPGMSLIYGFFFRESVRPRNSMQGRDKFTRNGEDFLHYHLRSAALCSDLSEALGMPVVSRSGLVDSGAHAEVVQESCRNSRPMPALETMPAVWKVLGTLIAACATDRDVVGALGRAATDMDSILQPQPLLTDR